MTNREASSESTSDSEFGGVWSQVLPFVIDEVVKALKRERRWRLDGPSLRLLNRYWRRQTSLHIQSVRPCGRGEKLFHLDPSPLEPFSGLTSIDISDLCQRRVDGVRLFNALRRLPLMSRLELPALTLTWETCKLGDKTTFRGRQSAPMSVPRALFFSLPVQQLSVEGTLADVAVVAERMPTLVSLSAVLHDVGCVSPSAFSAVEALHLTIVGRFEKWMCPIGSLSNLVSLTLSHAVDAATAEMLRELPKFSKLSCAVTPGQRDRTAHLAKLLTKLRALSVEYSGIRMGDLETVISEDASQLRSLCLTEFRGPSATLSRVQSLTQLCLLDCHIEGDMNWLPVMKRLQKLCLFGAQLAQTHGRAIAAALTHLNLPRLTVLCTHYCPICVPLLATSGQLSRLEILGLVCFSGCAGHRTLLDDLKELDGLKDLRELGIFGRSGMPTLNALARLQIWTRLETLWISSASDSSSWNAFLSRLAHLSPNLRIKKGVPLFLEFVRTVYGVNWQSVR